MSEVEEESVRSGEGNPFDHLHLEPVERCQVSANPDTTAPLVLVGHRHVLEGLREVRCTENARRGPVAGDGTGRVGEEGRTNPW